MKCLHDTSELKEDKDGSYECPKCGCQYRLIIVRNDTKCYAKRNPQPKKEA